MYLRHLGELPAAAGPSRKTVADFSAIPEGRAGVYVTLRAMRKLILQGKRDPNLREWVLGVVRAVPDKDHVGEARALFEWVRDRIRYVKDINGIETLHTPDKVLELGQGDCDDKAILLATALEQIGFETRLTAVAFAPGQFSHVFSEVKIGARWFALETTESVDFGWRPQGVVDQIVVYV